MKRKNQIFKILLILFLIVSGFAISAQNLYTVNVQKSDLKVKGTSSLHDWHMVAGNFNCTIKVQNVNNKLSIKGVDFSCNSNALKSENSIMDKKAWDALKAKEFKTIQFESIEPLEFNLQEKKIEGKLSGELFLSGSKRKVIIPFYGEIDEQGNLKFKGEINVKMSEFGIEPPTALMGTIKTGDEITIVYDFNFNQSTIISAK